MKKTYNTIKKLAFVLGLASFSNVNAQSYCSQVASSTADDDISYVSIGTLTNSSTCGQLGTGPGSVPFGYSNYTGGGLTLPNIQGSIPAPLLVPGQTYTMTLGLTMCGTFAYTGGFCVGIDFNQDGDFTDPGENVWNVTPFTGAIQPASTFTTNPNIIIPAGAMIGLTRMRISQNESGVPTNCSAITWGEVEDYCVFIAPTCTAAPNSNAATVNTPSLCPGLGVNLGLSPMPNTGGLTFQWEESPTLGGFYTSVPNATTSSFNTPTLSTSAAYRAIITCTNGSPITVTTTPVMVNVGPPAISNATTAIPLLCPGLTSSVGLNATYQGVGFLWQSSTLSAVGPWGTATTGTTAATSGTLPNYVSSPLNVTTYFQAVLSCTAAPSLSTVSNPVTINIAGTTTNTVPYYESFEGVGVNNFMPNCSWAASNPTIINQTYTTANTFFRIPNTGSKFASFKGGTNPNGDYFYTNGIYLEPGITYSASVDYITDGTIAWTEFGMHLGTTQAVTSLTNLVNVNSSFIANTFYKNLSQTFTVGTAGLYYLAIKCKGASNGNFLTFDDVSITAPCSINSPSLSVSGPTAVCSGQPFTYNVTGADSYVWSNNGATTSSVNLTLTGTSPVVVVGTSSISSCSSTLSTLVNVNQSPPIAVSAANNSTYVCKGSSLMLFASGAGQGGLYTWSSGTTGISISVSPTVQTSYTVSGTNANGCNATAVQVVGVKNLPSVNAIASSNNMCAKESVTLTATGANSYTWASNNTYIVGTQVVVSPFTSTTFSVSGSDNFNCEAKTTVSVNVSECVGINELKNELSATLLYPNPTNGLFTLEFANDSKKTIEVVDITGRVVLSAQSNALTTDLNISELSAGVYYVNVKENDASKTLRVVKQ
jgi:hypothetical protein